MPEQSRSSTPRSAPRARRSPALARAVALACPVIVGAGVAAPAAAQGYLGGFELPHSTWSVFGGVTHSTNATRQPDGQSDTIASVGVSGSLFRDEGRLTYRLVGNAAYEEYLENTYDGDVRASVNAGARYEFVPDRISWSVDNTFGQSATNTFAPSTPENRTNVNYFSTGPDVDLRLGGVAGLGLGARYARTDYSEGVGDDQRYSGNARLYRRLSATSTAALNASFQRVRNEDEFGFGFGREREYDTREYFASLDAQRARYGFSLGAGLSELSNEGRAGSESEPLVRASAYRRLSPALNLNLSAGQEFRSGGDILRDAIGETRIVNGQIVFIGAGIDPQSVGAVLADLSVVNQPVKYQYARASLDWARTRTTFSIAGGQGRERYQNPGIDVDRDFTEAGLSASRRLRPNLSAQASVNWNEREFRQRGRGDQTLYAQLRLDWQLTSRFGLNFSYRHEDRQSDFSTFEYQENLFYVGVSYGPGRGPQPAGAGAAGP